MFKMIHYTNNGFYHSMRSIRAITFLSLYGMLTLMFNSRYNPFKVIFNQAAVLVSHSHLFWAILKLAGDIVSHSHLLLFFGALIITLTIWQIKCCPFINKQFSIDSFHEIRRSSLGFASLLKGPLQTIASDSLLCLINRFSVPLILALLGREKLF